METTFEVDSDKILEDALNTAERLIHEKPDLSEVVLSQLLKAYKDHHKALKLMGIAKFFQRKYQEAADHLAQALEINPEDAECYNDIALAYAGMEEFDKAQESLEKAVSLKPEQPVFYSNLALHYRQIGQHQKAIELFNKSLSINDKDVTVWVNMGGVYGEMKDTKNARSCFQKALEIDPNFAPAHVDLAFSYHLDGEWKKGFEEFEWRFKHFSQLKYYQSAYPEEKKWDGKTDLTGKRVVLYCEQGLGDTIHFARYIKEIKAKGCHTIVHCPPVLDSIMQRIEGVDETFGRDIVHNKGDEIPEYDYHCSIMSLPHLLKSYKISGKPYISPIVTLKTKEQEAYKDTFNIGISWCGSPSHPNDKARSFHLSNFTDIHNLPGVKLFSLQVDLRQRMYENQTIVDYSNGCDNLKIVDMSNMIQIFEDSLTIVSGLDLVITCDTALLHLCGAAGIPCWGLIPFNPDWRWTLEGNITEWYDSVRLFRQTKPMDWKEVFEQVKEKLNEDFLSNK
jgi:Flp pilus assembly protein TadD